MSSPETWSETESAVWYPAMWLPGLVGSVFLTFGVLALVLLGGQLPPGMPAWIPRLVAVVFCLFGAGVLVWSITSRVWPSRVRHAEKDVPPDVPDEPVLREGSIVFGRVMHELVETEDAWEFRPAPSLWRSDKRFLFGFGIPFLIVFAGILTWVFHQQLNWILSAVLAIFVTIACGGTCFTIIGLVMRMGFRRHARLLIPHGGDDLQWESPVAPDIGSVELTGPVDPAAIVSRMFLEDVPKEVRTLPRDQVVAVQLCPWKVVVGSSNHSMTTWAVQGLIVLVNPQTETYERHPVMLTNHFAGAARLMRQVSEILQVPYLFSATTEGWKAEFQRAKSRPPLRSGGFQG